MVKQEKLMWIYTWDIQDEGISNTLDRIQGSGITGINVAALYHSGRFFLPHNPKKKMYFPEPGALYLKPDEKWFGNSPIKSPISKIANNNFWKDLRQETKKRNMTLTCWLLGFHNSQVARSYPELSVVNAFGEYVEVALDPAHSYVKDYFTNLINDIAKNFEFDRILLESFEYMPFRHDYHHEVIGVPLTPSIEFFMSLSFSDAMKNRAIEENIDIDAVQRYVKQKCIKHFENPHNGVNLSWESIYQAVSGEMRKYLNLRKKINTEVIESIFTAVRRVNTDIILSALDFGPLFGMGPYETEWENGIDLLEWSKYIDEVHPTFYFNDEEFLNSKIADYESILNKLGKEKPKVLPALRAILPQVSSQRDLKSQIQLLNTISNGFSFYNYGFMSYQNLNWIKNSID